MGISVIATETSNGVKQFWYSRDLSGLPSKRMRPLDLLHFLHYLEEMAEAGYPPLTWNGQVFDFPLLGIEITKGTTTTTQLHVWRRIRKLSAAHYDPMLQVWWTKGWPVGLDKAGRGMGIGGKLRKDGIAGSNAAEHWQRGEYGLVMLYNASDTALTAQVAQEILRRENPGLVWQSSTGTGHFCAFRKGLLTVADVVKNKPPVRPLVSPSRALDWWYSHAPPEPDQKLLRLMEAVK
jgi:hypothetical protein